MVKFTIPALIITGCVAVNRVILSEFVARSRGGLGGIVVARPVFSPGRSCCGYFLQIRQGAGFI